MGLFGHKGVLALFSDSPVIESALLSIFVATLTVFRAWLSRNSKNNNNNETSFWVSYFNEMDLRNNGVDEAALGRNKLRTDDYT